MVKRKAQRGRKRKAQCGRKKASRGKRKKRTQRGGGAVSVVAGLPKAAWSITKGLGKLAKKNAAKDHEKMEREIREGKRKTYSGESFICAVM